MLKLSKQNARSLALGLAAVAFFGGSAGARAQSLAEKIQLCGGCHGEDGNSTIEKLPSLAGQPDFFILNQLFLIREGVRPIAPMADVVRNMKDEEMEALASHFSKLAPKASEERIDPELARKGEALASKMRCVSCHLPTLGGQKQMPRLARQRIDYLFESMKSFRDNRRSGADTAMTAVIVGASDADLLALAHYASGK